MSSPSMSMTTRSSKRRKPEEVIQSSEEISNATNSQNTEKQSSGEIPKESHQEQNNAEKQKEGQQQNLIGKEGEGTSLVDNHYLLPDDDDDQPMFEGSRISVKNFCNELFSIADTYELPEKACNDVLRLVKRMAPHDALINFPKQIGDLQTDFASPSKKPQLARREESNRDEKYMDEIMDSLDKLAEDVNSLKCKHARNSSQRTLIKTIPDETKRVALRRIKQDNEKRRLRYFFKILNESNKIVSICDLEKDELVRSVRISRDDVTTRIMYKNEDITERVLQKLDISMFLHNPSYCGRAVADTLFNPEFLSRYHILAEGQNNTRSNRKLMPPELSSVFFDSLRKLGVSRIVEEDQIGWLEQARDAVNQRNRDIKIPGCRRKYFQNEDPIFK